MSQLHPSSLARGQRSPDDVSCIHCGYMLRGLNARGTCPECGTPIFKSLRGDGLEFADDRWLTHLRRGTSLLFWYAILSIAVGILGGILTSVGSAGPHRGTVLTFLALAIALDLMWLAGVYFVTTTEPRAAGDESPFSLLQLIRYGAAAAFLTHIAAIGVELSGKLDTLLAIIPLGAAATYLSVCFGLGMVYRRLALRMQDYDLAAHTRTAVWGLIAAYGMIVLFGVVTMLLGTQGATRAAAAVFGCGAVVAVLATWGFTIWIIRLLRRYEYALLHAERKASRPAEVPPPPPPAPEE